MKPSVHRLFLGAAAAIGLLAAGNAGAATPVSPAGTWDCIVSGSQGVGLAYLTFADDGTFTGYEMLTTRPPTVPGGSIGSSTTGRNSGGDIGRYVAPSSINPDLGTSGNGLFGFGELSGPWGFDLGSGNTIGYFQEAVSEGGTLTNINRVGFWAKVVPGRQLWLVASTPNGKVIYNGVPLSSSLSDLTGSWYAYNFRKGQRLTEFFDVTPTDQPFLYTVSGHGPGYHFDGVAMLSSRNKMGLVCNLTQGTATAQATGHPIVTGGLITGAVIDNPGQGYTTAPAVSIVDAAGLNANISATVSNGVVTALLVTDPGIGYSSSAQLTIAAPSSSTESALRSTVGTFNPRNSVACTRGNESPSIWLNYNAALYGTVGK